LRLEDIRMLLARQNDILTRERLIASRWSWGMINQPEMTKSFYFGDDGLIKVYQDDNERSWSFTDGLLRIFNNAGELTWVFEIVFQAADDRLILISKYQNDPAWQPFFCLTEYRATARAAGIQTLADDDAAVGQDDSIRLVIWDLDETFWQGTLSEGPVTPILDHLAIVRALNERGIMSAICSKNHFEPTQALLKNLGIWDEFVFPEIAFAPKGPMVQRIVENIQLRPASILFIDDNVTNLNEALYYLPRLQIAEPAIIPTLLADPRLAGKPDPQKTRLARYKILERKAVEKSAAAGDNQTFLRDSAIRVSFHTDIELEFPRIHDLVNRTNQLNFTKNRWPEDSGAALDLFHQEQKLDFNSHAGYIKVSDRYGQYGICGYFHVIQTTCRHFLFSCRAMNMGVEQFVWSRLGRPYVPISGDVISDIDMPVDWITIVPDADIETPIANAATRQTICIRGACDMSMTSNFLRTKADTLEELTYAWQGWEICSLPRIVALHDELQNPENQAIIARLPGMPPNRFASDIIAGTSDAYVLSFSQESFHGLYRSKSTGMILPMGHFSIDHFSYEKPDFTNIPFADLQTQNIAGITAEQWDFLAREFEFLGGFNQTLFESDVDHVFSRLRAHGKPVIIIGLNETTGTDGYILSFFARINQIVRPLAQHYGFSYIDIAGFIQTLDDLAPDGTQGGPHFARHVYAKIAEAVLEMLNAKNSLVG
jgi:FkbH-like protein